VSSLQEALLKAAEAVAPIVREAMAEIEDQSGASASGSDQDRS
jgi:hypothetical protein